MGKYYDTLKVHQKSKSPRNEVGDLIPEKLDWDKVSPCRDEPAGAGATVNVEGGKTITYSSNIFCPVTCPDIAENSTVQVENSSGQVQVTGTVLRFKRYKHYVKIWI
ncbi:hypothetical protein M2451_002640 [Dysgonomonas sp. PFB1-18]|uniref:hypothetical protein n=1 Tax=unclassified Dysgonomonas TaxID=2630389 RepID=UPI0024768E82|nr:MULTISPECIES: hypothetical protein [unclassified Dysgonomonas]MDH6308121.1 hypothetical protein [Dysgonomonas sp. PF1-14]MDH6339660.1 hypothetical protein [Dysgonomonas sp. PF1-16]MDH6381311.1 hypothetical protein [Dysgonomonas sp. PFB1-18]MDH6398523.1 hypothetical protein [Dysgonomonas sp. PF1-23]